MTERSLAVAEPAGTVVATAIEQVLIGGDLTPLTPQQRVSYYNAVCRSLDLNPLTRPFDYIKLNGRLVLYTKKDATDQIRLNRGVSITRVSAQYVDDLYVVTADAKDRDGRTDSGTGAVCMTGLTGEAKANAIMKAETKAKRRVTLSICGLGMTDDSEIDSIEDVKPVNVNHETGEIIGQAPPLQPPQRKPAPSVVPVSLTPTPSPLGPTGTATTRSASREPGDEPEDPFGDFGTTPPESMAPTSIEEEVRTGKFSKGGAVITEAQRKRLFAVAMGKGWSKDAYREQIQRFGFDRDNNVTTVAYEAIVEVFQGGPR
jgi:hypothetical protein